VPLSKLAKKIGSGATPLGGESAYQVVRSNYALVRSQNVFDRRFETSGLAFISDEQAARLKGAALLPDDLLLNITGDGVTFGRCCAVSPDVLPACVNQHVSIVWVDQSIAHPGYVLSFLTHPDVKPYIESFNAGGSRRAITKGSIESFKLALPPIEEQRAIAHILGTLDDKIELNRRMNETLEAIARAIFKSWFVDFDPVRAKASGEPPESICRRLGLAPDLLTLFPDRLVDSALGKIPKGWEVKPLDSLANYLNGLALQKYPPENQSASLPVVKIAQLKRGNTQGADRASGTLNPNYIVDDGDVLFSWSGSLEVEIWSGGRGALNQHLFKVTSAAYPKWFFFYWTKEHLADFRQIAAGKAVTMGHIQRKHLTEALCPVPPSSAVQRADETLSPLLARQLENRKESRVLAAIRDTLLPKLLSGELQIGDARTILKKAIPAAAERAHG
jgi:type I restriction enzyme, S subunit